LKAGVKQLAAGDLCAVQAVFASAKPAILASLFSRRSIFVYNAQERVCSRRNLQFQPALLQSAQTGRVTAAIGPHARTYLRLQHI
jgi:hypothetical protein